MNTGNDYSTIRKKLRTRIYARRSFLLGVIGFIIPAPVAYYLPDFYNSIKEYIFVYWAMPCWLTARFSGLYLHNGKCPRCGKRFSVRSNGLLWNDFTNKCINCKLPLFDSKE